MGEREGEGERERREGEKDEVGLGGKVKRMK